MRNGRTVLKPIVSAVVFTLVLFAAPVGRAIDAGDVLKTVAVGTLVREFSDELDKFVNTLTLNKKMPVGATTRVVPLLSMGDKSYIGAVQFFGAEPIVNKVEAALQYEAAFDSGKYRVKVILPTEDTNILKYKSVQGVGISALIDIAIAGDAPPLKSGGVDTGDALRAVAIGAAVNLVSDEINGFINKLRGWDDANADYATKVVPYLSFGERSYIGGVQIAGPPAAVAKVKAVWQYEAMFDNGKFRVRAIVPTDSLNPLQMQRVKGVGVTAVIDTTVATSVGTPGRGGSVAPAAGSGNAQKSGAYSAADADSAIDRASEYIKDSKKKVDALKKGYEDDDDDDHEKEHKKGKGKKGKEKSDHGKPAHADANKRLADARHTLAKAREARAKGNYDEAVRLANESMRIADSAVSMM